MTTTAPAEVTWCEIDVIDEPRLPDIEFLEARLDAFSVIMSGHADARRLAVLARDAEDRIVGGIHGWTWGGCCEVVSLWVDERARGGGLGTMLLSMAETAACRRGCHQVVAFTHGGQEPDLYVDARYEVVGMIDDYPRGSTAFWFRKRLPVHR